MVVIGIVIVIVMMVVVVVVRAKCSFMESEGLR